MYSCKDVPSVCHLLFIPGGITDHLAISNSKHYVCMYVRGLRKQINGKHIKYVQYIKHVFNPTVFQYNSKNCIRQNIQG